MLSFLQCLDATRFFHFHFTVQSGLRLHSHEGAYQDRSVSNEFQFSDNGVNQDFASAHALPALLTTQYSVKNGAGLDAVFSRHVRSLTSG
jgi:hypothetical protein